MIIDLNRKVARTEFLQAFPRRWGPSKEIFAIIGSVGSRTTVKVQFWTTTDPPSTFDVEIVGGDYPIITQGSGQASVPISGNVIAGLHMQCRSHSHALDITVHAST